MGPIAAEHQLPCQTLVAGLGTTSTDVAMEEMRKGCAAQSGEGGEAKGLAYPALLLSMARKVGRRFSYETQTT